MNQMSSPGGNLGLAGSTPKHSSPSTSPSSGNVRTQSYAVHSACATEMNKSPMVSGEYPPNQEEATESGRENTINQEKGRSVFSNHY